MFKTILAIFPVLTVANAKKLERLICATVTMNFPNGELRNLYEFMITFNGKCETFKKEKVLIVK